MSVVRLKKITRFLSVTGMAICAVLPAGNAPAADGVTDSTQPATLFDTRTPPQFNQALGAQLSNLYSSCANFAPQLEQMGSIILNHMNKAPNASSLDPRPVDACSYSLEVPEADSLEGSAFLKGMTCDKAKYDRALQKVKNAADGLACRKGKIDLVKNQVSCLISESNLLSQQVASLQGAFQQNIQRMQTEIGMINSVIKDREKQQEEIVEKLQGNGKTGAKGLEAIEQEMQQIINTVPAEVEQITQIGIKRKTFESQVEDRRMVLTNECFTTRTNPQWKCDGKLLNAKDYVLCRYRQNLMLEDGGIRSKNKNTESVRDQAASQLEAILAGIVADSPSNYRGDPNASAEQRQQQAMEQATKPVSVRSYEDVVAQYSAQLGTLRNAGIDVKGFVLTEYQRCYNRSKTSVGNDRKRPGGMLYNMEQQLLVEERDVGKKADVLLNNYSKLYGDAIASLAPGAHAPLGISNCESGSVVLKQSCINEARNAIESLFHGNGAMAQMSITLKGSDSRSTVTVSCSGVSGCKRALSGEATRLKDEHHRLNAAKKQYVQNANQSIENFTKSMAERLGPSSQRLMDRIKGINLTLASIGSGTINLKALKGEKLKASENEEMGGLYNTPDKALELIGGYMNPPMLDVSGNDFSEALEDLGKSQRRLEDRSEKIAVAQNAIEGAWADCEKELAKRRGEKAAKIASDYLDSNCSLNDLACDDAQKHRRGGDWADLANMMGEINDGYLSEDMLQLQTALSQGAACKITREDMVAKANGAPDAEKEEIQKQLGAARMKNTCVSISRNVYKAAKGYIDANKPKDEEDSGDEESDSGSAR